jgi:anti-sigma B factor antagonist
MEIENVTLDEHTRILRLSGELDVNSAEKVKQTIKDLVAKGVNRMVINLAEVCMIDSTGLAALISGFKAMNMQKGEMRLISPRPEVRVIFKLTLLERVFKLHATEEKALASFAV